jgi:hypothetical protein
MELITSGLMNSTLKVSVFGSFLGNSTVSGPQFYNSIMACLALSASTRAGLLVIKGDTREITFSTIGAFFEGLAGLQYIGSLSHFALKRVLISLPLTAGHVL